MAIVVGEHNTFGTIDNNGEFIIPFGKFKSLGDFSGGMAYAVKAIDKHNFCYGYIDKAGKTIIPFKYTRAGIFENHLARVWTGTVIKRKSSRLYTPTEGGYIDRNGKEFWEN